MKKIHLFLLAVAPISMIALEYDALGYFSLFCLTIFLFREKNTEYRISIVLIIISLLILNHSPISTDTGITNILTMGIPLLLISFGSIYISKWFLSKPLHIRITSGEDWSAFHLLYPLGAFIIALILIPRYFSVNPEVPFHRTLSSPPVTAEFTRLFRGSNFLGMRDEIFFINVIFALLRRYTSFRRANVVQACFFVSFLYELAFTGIGPLFIFMFALLQGYMFEKRDAVGYIIIIHLLVDTALYLSIINSHFPGHYSRFPLF